MNPRFVAMLAITSTVFACASKPPPTQGLFVRAQPAPDPPTPSPVVVQLPPAPDSGSQLKPMPPPAVAKVVRPANAQQVVLEANRKASAAPDRGDYFNAVVQYAYEPGTLYQIYGTPHHVVDIALEPGEKIMGQPASGDVVRWILAVGLSVDHGQPQSHVYLMPTHADLQTNLAINTDRRTYLLELQSYPDTYMAAVTWRYPQDEIARLQLQADAASAQERSTSPIVSLDALNFNYRIHVEHGSPVWTPVQVFDDGRRTFIRFPPAMLVREAPALFVLRDHETQLVNYRVKGDTYVVDRLIESAELRVGQQDQEIVRIERASKR